MKRSLGILLLVGLLVLVFFNSVYAQNKPFEGVTLRVAIVSTEDSKYLATGLAPRLEKETGIKLIVDQVPYDELNAKQLMDAAGAKTYDIINPCTEWSRQYMAFAEPINPYIGKEGFPNPEIDDIIPGIWKVWNPGKDIYWFPYQPDSRVFYYRNDLLQEAGMATPQIWEDAKVIAAKLNKEGSMYGFGYPGRRGFSMNLAWIPILFSSGGDVFDKDLKPTLNSQAGVDSLNFLLELLKFGPKDIASFGEFEHYGAAKEGRIAMGIEASGITQALESADSKVRGKMGYGLFPVKAKDVIRPNTAIMGGWSLGVANYSKNKDAAAWVVLWLTSKEIVTDWQIHGRAHASRLSMATNAELIKVNPAVPTIVETLAGAKLLFDGPETNELEEALVVPLSQAISGELSAKDALDVAAKAWADILDKAGYYKK